MFTHGNRKYKYVRIGLVRAACPREIENTRDNLNVGRAITINANENELGRVSAVRFVPAGIIVAGNARRRRLLAAGLVHDYAFVERRIDDIKCDDEISSNELMEKLNIAIRERILGPARANGDGNCAPGTVYPYILEVYPFENYFIYNLAGQKYRQVYVLDPVKKVLHLAPGSTKVEEKFIDATGDRWTPTSTPGNNQTVSPGASNSDLVIMLVRNWKNINEAVAMYLAAIRNGQHKPPMSVPAFAPVNLTPAGKLGTQIASKGIDVYDFARWSAAEQSKEGPKTKDGLPKSAYAYVGDSGDISTWHLKIHDKAHVANAFWRG